MAFTLTDEQLEIKRVIREEPDQSVLVSARAGAAKTSTIVACAEDIPPSDYPLAIAFNKRNAEELAKRLPEYFTCKTLNALGHAAWGKARGKRLTLEADKTYDLVKPLIAREFPGGGSKDSDEATACMSEVLALVRKAKSTGLVHKAAPMGVRGLILDTDSNWDDLAQAAGLWRYEDISLQLAREALLASTNMAFQGIIDFDDQIYMSVLFGGTYYKHPTVIVDESQDLSPLNHRQLQKVVGRRLIAIGDPFQAIYAFRGADNESMMSMGQLFDFKELRLTKSMRCSHVVAERQLDHVHDFGSMPFCKEGSVEHWPLEQDIGDADPSNSPHDKDFIAANSGWSIDQIPEEGFVLCRNNAPLMKLAFALIKNRRPVKILGRDIGASLANLLLKICGKSPLPVADAYEKVREWKARELAKVGDSEAKQAIIYDRSECLSVLLEASGSLTHMEAADFIKALFSDKAGGDKLVFSSGHKIKGFESHWVLHLDPQRIPSIFAEKALAKGHAGPMTQELNLKYVIETRSSDVLVLAALDDCEEMGE